MLPNYPQHLVLAYVPKEKVVKEFIRVKPRGFLFHEQHFSPFQALINWFKDNWRDRIYQRGLKRQRSPRCAARTVPQSAQKNEPSGDWGGQELPMKVESKGVKAEGNWGGD